MQSQDWPQQQLTPENKITWRKALIWILNWLQKDTARIKWNENKEALCWQGNGRNSDKERFQGNLKMQEQN